MHKRLQRTLGKIKDSSELRSHKGIVIYFLCVVLLALYMLIVQSSFTLTGDTWAEAFPEYVNDVLTKEPSDIVESSWAGYLTVVPSFLTQAYISSPLPLGNIDYYFRAVTVLFAILCCSFIAHPFNRQFIRSDALRILLAFLTLLSICHASSLAFINIWYVGFIVIILICAGSRQLSLRKEIAFTIFALLVCLSKPSLIVLPFVAYRLTRQFDVNEFIRLSLGFFAKNRAPDWREWLTGSWRKYRYGIIGSVLLTMAVVYETYLTVFGTNGFSGGSANTNPILLVSDIILASGTMLLKSLSIPAPHISVVLVSSAIVATLFLTLFKQSKLLTLTLGACLVFGVYLHIYSPDNTLNNVWSTFDALYDDQTKLQRELLPTFILLFVLFMNIDTLLRNKYFAGSPRLRRSMASVLIISLILIVQPLSPILTRQNSHLYSINIDAYRSSLNINQPICMPVAPTVFLDNSANWFFQYSGGCYQLDKKTFSTSSFTHRLNSNKLGIQLGGNSVSELKTIILPVKSHGSASDSITIVDNLTGKKYFSPLENSPSEYQQVSFNVAGLSSRDNGYSFSVSSSKDNVFIGQDIDGKTLVYGLYIGTRP